MLLRIKTKLSKKSLGGRVLTAAYQPVDDPLQPIAIDLAAIIEDIQAIAMDKPAAKRPVGDGQIG
ncbi:MAG: hypothetical protein ACT4OU_06705 [Hyphomicrobium sp.]